MTHYTYNKEDEDENPFVWHREQISWKAAIKMSTVKKKSITQDV